MFNKSIVKNVPEYANKREYWVARWDEGELWFWGAWDDLNRAVEVALDIQGVLCH